MVRWIARLFVIALLSSEGYLHGADRTFVAAPNTPAMIKGNLAAGKDESRVVAIKRGKEARLMVVSGRRAVTADIYDSQNLAANEGVSEEDWFPVSEGLYTITVTNVTALGRKSGGRSVAYEIRIEVR